jgi:aryl-alcohol dehydrogenase-like predicted oxidoreductase
VDGLLASTGAGNQPRLTAVLAGPIAGTEQTWRIVDTLIQVADAHGKTPSQVALNWLLQQPGVTAPIFGARTPGQLEENLGSVGWALDVNEIDRLSSTSAIPLPSPYNFITRYTRKRH